MIAQHTRRRTLQDAKSGTVWSTACNGANVVISSRKNGKEKNSEKVTADAASAIVYAEKEEWPRLKKGFVLSEPLAQAGQPCMHRYLGRGYTGAMVAADVGGRFLCNQFDSALERDVLFVLDAEANVLSSVALPQPHMLVWSAKYCPSLDLVLLCIDHRIFSYSLQTQSFQDMTPPIKRPASFLSLSGARVAWFDDPCIVVHDLAAGQTIFQWSTSEHYRGHSLLPMAELSPDGGTLACCSHNGEIFLIDLESQESSMMQGSLGDIEKLGFSSDGSRLFVQEQYGDWGLYCFNVQEGQIEPAWTKLKDMYTGDFAHHPSLPLMAVSRRQWIEIFDLERMSCRFKFRADHVVKKCALTFVGELLGVRTDYGCASLYCLN